MNTVEVDHEVYVLTVRNFSLRQAISASHRVVTECLKLIAGAKQLTVLNEEVLQWKVANESTELANSVSRISTEGHAARRVDGSVSDLQLSRLLIFNPLEHARLEVVCVRTAQPNVKVLDIKESRLEQQVHPNYVYDEEDLRQEGFEVGQI